MGALTRLAAQQARPADGPEEGVRHDGLGALQARAQPPAWLALQQRAQQALRGAAQEGCARARARA